MKLKLIDNDSNSFNDLLHKMFEHEKFQYRKTRKINGKIKL